MHTIRTRCSECNKHYWWPSQLNAKHLTESLNFSRFISHSFIMFDFLNVFTKTALRTRCHRHPNHAILTILQHVRTIVCINTLQCNTKSCVLGSSFLPTPFVVLLCIFSFNCLMGYLKSVLHTFPMWKP